MSRSSPQQPVGSTQADRAHAELRRRILDNDLTSGQQVLEGEAAILLGMSRTPVREAMIRLAHDGLVELRARHGMQVLPISAVDMKEIYDVLTALESIAAALAAQRRPGAEQLRPLEQAIGEMDMALADDDLELWATADERFHLALVELAGNGRIQHLVNTYWDQSHRVRMTTLRLRPRPNGSNADHAALVDAIRRGEAEHARRIHHEHRERNAMMLVDLLNRLGLKKL